MFECFTIVKSTENIDTRAVAKFDPWAMIGTIYNGDYQTLLHTKYRSSGPCGFREEDFLKLFFPLKVYGIYLLPWKPQL